MLTLFPGEKPEYPGEEPHTNTQDSCAVFTLTAGEERAVVSALVSRGGQTAAGEHSFPADGLTGTPEQVYQFAKAGAQGIGSSSGICLSEDPCTMLDRMVASVRRAIEELT